MPINLISQTELASFVKQNPFKEDKLFSDIDVHFNYGFMLVEAVLYNTPGCSITIYHGNHMTTTEHSYPIPLKYGLADANNTQASGHLFVPTHTVIVLRSPFLGNTLNEFTLARPHFWAGLEVTATSWARAGSNNREPEHTKRTPENGQQTYLKTKWLPLGNNSCITQSTGHRGWGSAQLHQQGGAGQGFN